jgi:hypothetical protein
VPGVLTLAFMERRRISFVNVARDWGSPSCLH